MATMPGAVDIAQNVATDHRDVLRRSDSSGHSQAAAVTAVAAPQARLRAIPAKKATPRKSLSNRKHVTVPRVEAVKQSRHTWAFRLRWNSAHGRPIQYASRVSDSVWQAITSDKERYAAFKQQLIAQTDSSPIRKSH